MTPFKRRGNARATVNLITISETTIHGFLIGPASMTANACFITWNKAYCLFPQYTYTHGKMMLESHRGHCGFDSRHEAVKAGFTKHNTRGWIVSDRSVKQGFDPVDQSELAFRQLGGTRRIDDVETWSIPLDCTNIPGNIIELDRGFVERCSFRVNIVKSENEIYSDISTDNFECCMLRYRYTFDFAAEPEDDFHGHLRYILCRKAASQIRHHQDVDDANGVMKNKLNAALALMSRVTERDFGYTGEWCPVTDILDYGESFEGPDGWEYAEDLIPQIYEDWHKHQPYSRAMMKVKPKIKEEQED